MNDEVQENSDAAQIARAKAARSKPVSRKRLSPTDLFALISDREEQAWKEAISLEVGEILRAHSLEAYETLMLFDDVELISNDHSNSIYAAASSNKRAKNILLVLHSRGGSIEPAYLLSKTLKRLSKDKFVVAIPRRAKSAATLISLGADEIHMGMISQLGPIDPQIGNLPVQALGNALETVVGLAAQYPSASEMLSKYLSEQIPLQYVGYYKRINESAEQYAERLLFGKHLANGQSAQEVAKHFVNHYKDHSFVIDANEAIELLGAEMIREETKEYAASDEIFKLLDLASVITRFKHSKNLTYVGSIATGLKFQDATRK